MTRHANTLLLVFLYFGALSAFSGGVLGVAANGAGVPLQYLRGTTFTSYLAPGLILGIVVGGTQALAAVLTQARRPIGPLASTVAGSGMIIWIFVELAVVGFSWLQVVYLALGMGELLLVAVKLGLWDFRHWARQRTLETMSSSTQRSDSCLRE